MKPFTRLTATAVALDRADVDTDQIMPKQFLKRIERTGFGEFLFFDWRKEPGFELNAPEAQGARILLAGRNFGCGSSREHAPWGLQQYGFDVVVAPSFGDIFRQNSVQIGLVPIVLPAEEVKRLMAFSGQELTVDLEARTIASPDEVIVQFPFDEHERHRILKGLDDIGLTLSHVAEIAAFESAHPAPIRTLSV